MQKFLDTLNKTVILCGAWVLAFLGGVLAVLLTIDLYARVTHTDNPNPLEPFPGVSIFWGIIAFTLCLAPVWIGSKVEEKNRVRDEARAIALKERKAAEHAAYWKAEDERLARERTEGQAIARVRLAETNRRIAEREAREAAERKVEQAAADRARQEKEAKAATIRQAEEARLAALPPRTAAPRPTEAHLDGEL